MTTLYVAGPMAGKPNQNWDAFNFAAEQLRAAGYAVRCPTEDVPQETHALGVQLGEGFRQTAEYRSLMLRDIGWIAASDGIALLPEYEFSKGALAEVAFAECCGMPVQSVNQWLDQARTQRAIIQDGDAAQIRWTGDRTWQPSRKYEGDAGFDLYVSSTTQIPYDGFVDVPCGISVELPRDCWAMIVGRSSTVRERKLLVNTGIIDSGYRGPLFAGVWNLGEKATVVRQGERIAQLIPMPLTAARLPLHRVAELGPSDRGTSGFGSTGV